jgi:hypothetical protein
MSNIEPAFRDYRVAQDAAGTWRAYCRTVLIARDCATADLAWEEVRKDIRDGDFMPPCQCD